MSAPSPRRGKNNSSADSKEDEGAGGIFRFILTVAIFAWLLRSLVVTPFNIPSGSMLPTLYIGDYVAVAKWPYGYSRFSFPFDFPSFPGRVFGRLPQRGDVAVFRHPTEGNDLIKRVIGLPGDVVAVQQGRLFLNGRPVARQPLHPYKLPISPNTPCKTVPPVPPVVEQVGGKPFCVFRAFRETLPGGPSYTVLDQLAGGAGDDFPATRVPAGHIFLMGDNRDDSLDSRFSQAIGGISMVPTENLIGRGLVTFWSTEGGAVYWKPWTWFSNLRARRIGNRYSGDAE